MNTGDVTESHRGPRLPGRKAGSLRIRVAQSEYATFELRVDIERGDWIVAIGDSLYRCADKAKLEGYVEKLLQLQRAVTWTRYLVIDYEAEGPGDFGNRRRYAPDDKRRDRDVEVAAIRLDWEVWDYSDPIQHPGQTIPRRKSREVFIHERKAAELEEDEGIVWSNRDELPDEYYSTEGWLHDNKIPDGAVVFTPDRHALLRSIRAAMGRLDGKLVAVFNAGTPAELAAKLDRAGLAAGIAGLPAAPKGSESE